ncbi:MAG: FAD-dependent oxidoreductase, partial [Planctomycetota bacterium]
MGEHRTDVLIVGGGTGGVAAALAACDLGARVVLTEPTPWLGGQLTSQAVPPDEHRWIEQFGCTASYRRFRDGVRRYYRDHYPLTEAARRARHLNPGGGDVSRLCFEPRVGLAVIDTMLAAHRGSGLLTVLYGIEPIDADVHDGKLMHVDFSDGTTVSADVVLDATELGDLLPLAGVPYTIGSEAQSETGEPDAPSVGELDDVQSFTWVAAIDHDPEHPDPIAKPASFDRWMRAEQPDVPGGRLIDWPYTQPTETFSGRGSLFEEDGAYSLFRYRQVVDPAHVEGAVPTTLLNWPQNDYAGGRVVGVPAELAAPKLEDAKELTRCVVYWLQQQDPGIRLRPDLLGTNDGFALAPYHREGRRIRARFTVTQQHVAAKCRPDGKAEVFDDSVGIGAYRMDLHPSASGRPSMYAEVCPFQIPMNALLPTDGPSNLIAAAKNIGTTHLTNGCYRLHPIEWNIGEAAGVMAVVG